MDRRARDEKPEMEYGQGGARLTECRAGAAYLRMARADPARYVLPHAPAECTFPTWAAHARHSG